MRAKRLYAYVLTLVLLLALMAGSSFAQEPPAEAHGSTSARKSLATSFPYEGYLAEAGGLVSDRCDLRFSLYDATHGENHVGTALEGMDADLVEGWFRVELSFGIEAFSGEARWLELEVRCPAGDGPFTTLAPRQGLLPSPGIQAPLGLWTLPEALRPAAPAGPSRAEASPLVNRSFEDGVFSPTGSPTGWVRDFWNPAAWMNAHEGGLQCSWEEGFSLSCWL